MQVYLTSTFISGFFLTSLCFYGYLQTFSSSPPALLSISFIFFLFSFFLPMKLLLVCTSLYFYPSLLSEEMQANAAAGQEVELGDGMDTQQVHVIVHR